MCDMYLIPNVFGYKLRRVFLNRHMKTVARLKPFCISIMSVERGVNPTVWCENSAQGLGWEDVAINWCVAQTCGN